MSYRLDERLRAGSHALATLPLCEARLQDDARFAWIVLVPRRAEMVELAHLTEHELRQLARETSWAAAAVRAIGAALGRPVAKLNHGQLGNVVAQLHVHVVGRRTDDAAWPGPVWGQGAAEPYAVEALATALQAAQGLLSPRGRRKGEG